MIKKKALKDHWKMRNSKVLLGFWAKLQLADHPHGSLS